MKNQFQSKYTSFTIAICAAIFSLSSCKQESKPEDTKEVAEEKNEAKFENTKEDEAKFLVDVTEFNLEQAELGKLTALKSNNAEVKAFGSMMERMHNENIKDISALAASKQISIPTSLTDDNKDDYNALNKKDIDDFDKQYIDRVVEEHKKAIEHFTDQADKTSDADSKTWLATQLALLREHLDNAMTLQSKLENKR